MPRPPTEAVRLGRLLRRVVGAALLVAIVFVLVFRSWVAAQGQAAVVLSIAADVPVLTWIGKVLTDAPHVEEVVVAGAPTTLVRPAGDGPWPAIVFVNGVTRRGRHHPTVSRLARGLARAGYLVLVPDPPGLAHGEVTNRTLASVTGVARAAASRRDTRDGRVALVGVSVGATLALLAAEAPSLADRVRLVAGIAPYTDLADAIRLATTGFHRENGRLARYEAKPFLSLVIGRSLVASLRPGPARATLLARLRAVDDDAHDPLEELRTWPTAELGPEASALVRLLASRHVRRFDRLYAALPARLRAGIDRLSPIHGAERLPARVELVSAPHDKYFPLDESRTLVERAPNAQLTVSTTLAHAVPRLSLRDFKGLFRLDAFIVRSLHGLR